MNRIRGRRTWKIIAAMILLLAGGICFVSRSFSLDAVQKQGDKKREYWEKVSASAVLYLWREWYPAHQLSGMADDKKNGDPAVSGSGWLVDFIMRQVPYYRAEGERDGERKYQGVDPAYEDYVESHKLLSEYEHLVRGLSNSAVLSSGSNPLSQGTRMEAAEGKSGKEYPAGMEDKLGNAQASERRVGNSAGTELFDQTGRLVTGTQYIEEQLADYDFLMKHFYTVHPTTSAGRDMMNAKTFLSEDFSLEKGGDQPQILIYHTHSQEEFKDYYTGNQDATIVGVGTYLTELLEKKGYSVIHDVSVYDLKDGKLDRSKAYTYALDGITGILQKYPSIQVVLDVHRDGVREGTHLVQEVNGKQTATIMFFNGTSQTPAGPIEYLKNPYRTDNMAFSFQMKLCADAYYPGFTRKIYLKGLRYNMHMRPRSALIEVGAQTNTYEEAKNAMEPLSELLDMVLRPK